MTREAKSILARLGGAAFQIRTGARNPQPVPAGLSLDLPTARSTGKADRARVTRNARGTYSLEIIKRNGRAFRWIAIADDVPAAELTARFVRMTGLEA